MTNSRRDFFKKVGVAAGAILTAKMATTASTTSIQACDGGSSSASSTLSPITSSLTTTAPPYYDSLRKSTVHVRKGAGYEVKEWIGDNGRTLRIVYDFDGRMLTEGSMKTLGSF